jgi:hypothetical protein
MSEYAREWTRAIFAPIIVGLVAGFIGSQASLIVHGERIDAQGKRIEKIEAQIDDLRGLHIALARLEVETALTRATLDRLMVSVERLSASK